MKLLISFLPVCLLALTFGPCLSACYTPYAGMRLTLNNTFLSTAAHKILSKAFDYVHQLLHIPNNYTFGADLSLIKLQFYNISSVSFEQDSRLAGFDPVPRNLAFFFRMPLFNKWDIKFDYNHSKDGKTYTSDHGSLHVEDFEFRTEFKVIGADSSYYLQFLTVKLKMGKTRILFDNPPGILKFLQFLVNDCQPLYTFFLNYLARDWINFFLRFMPVVVPIPLIGNYALDLTPVRNIEMDEVYTTFYVKSEIFNVKTRTHSKASPPTDLHSIPIYKPAVVDLLINEHPINSMFSSMARSGDLTITLRDADVYKMTGFLHLRTTDFRFYIPELAEYGDLPMELKLNYVDTPPKMTITQVSTNHNEMNITGKMSAEFKVNKKGSAIKLEVAGDISLAMWFDQPKRDLYAKVNTLGISGIKILKNKMKNTPDVNEMKEDFNNLATYIMNAINIYALEKPFHIIEVIPLDVTNLVIKDVLMRAYHGVIGMAGNFTLED